MTMGDSTMLGGKAKDRTEGEDVSMVTICQNGPMLKGEVGLHEAARNGDNVSIESLLDQGYKVDSRNNLDRTPLHWSAANGHLETARLLIDRGAAVEAKDKYGMRALLWSAWFGRKEVFEYLLREVQADAKATNKQGMAILHCLAQNNNADVVESLFETVKNADQLDINRVEKNDRTPLHLAAMFGSVDVLRVLLAITQDSPKTFNQKKDTKLRDSRILNVSPNEVLDKQGYHPVHLAVLENKIDFLLELLDQKITDPIDVNIPTSAIKEGKTPLHLASEKGHLVLAEKLLSYDKCDIEGRTTKKQTPLHLAVMSGKKDIVRLLLDYGADVNAEDYHKCTPLHLAAEANEPRIIDILVAHDADVNAFNVRHQLPLHIAVEAGLGLVAEVLIVAGASLEDKEKSGKSSLYLAARGGFVTLVDMIVKAERQHMLNQTKRCVETQTGETEDDDFEGDDEEEEEEGQTGVKGWDEEEDDEVANGDIDAIQRQQALLKVHRMSVLVGRDVPMHPLTSPCSSPTPEAAAAKRKRRLWRPTRAAEDAICHHTGENIPFRKGDSVHLPYMRDILWKLGAKQLKEQEWKRMAVFWKFSESQIRAIEHQYTGQFSFREHGYRMLLIWLDGVPREDNPIRCLYECLAAIGRRDLAENIRKKVNEMNPGVADAKAGKCLVM